MTPLRRLHGYLPIEDHGLIGDGTTAALVGRDGAITWLCVPRFDSAPLFCALLDTARGGAFEVAPEGRLEASRQLYEADSGVLVTELRAGRALVRLTDALTLRSGADLDEDVAAGRGELLRIVEVVEGPVRLRIAIEPRGGVETEPKGEGLRLRCRARPDGLPPVTRLRMLAIDVGPVNVTLWSVFTLNWPKLWKRFAPRIRPRSEPMVTLEPLSVRAGPRLPSVVICAWLSCGQARTGNSDTSPTTAPPNARTSQRGIPDSCAQRSGGE